MCKISEACVLVHIEPMLTSHINQFGFVQKGDCNKALFAFTSTMNYFVENSNLPYVRPVPIFTQGFDVNITRDVVATHLRKLSNSAGSSDVISNVFLRLATPGLISPLTTIFQRSMFEAKIPDAWRVAKVLPLYKGKGTRGDPNAYRPISITSSVCKLLESIVKGQASGHLHATRLLSPTQHGFQPKSRLLAICSVRKILFWMGSIMTCLLMCFCLIFLEPLIRFRTICLLILSALLATHID